jgi:hypothetical protein
MSVQIARLTLAARDHLAVGDDWPAAGRRPEPSERPVPVAVVDVTVDDGYAFDMMSLLQLEVLALRHQLQVLQRNRPQWVRLAKTDRWFWVVLARLWTGWRSAIMIVKPEIVVAWHRRGFRLWWACKSRRRLGRPTVPGDVRTLIRSMSQANPCWGAPRPPRVRSGAPRPRSGDASGMWRSPRIRRRRGRPSSCAKRFRGTRRRGV